MESLLPSVFQILSVSANEMRRPWEVRQRERMSVDTIFVKGTLLTGATLMVRRISACR